MLLMFNQKKVGLQNYFYTFSGISQIMTPQAIAFFELPAFPES